jgi:mono/diheme cytochrome c family protein
MSVYRGHVTEIPEHLLKRSQSARAKATGDPAPADAAAPTSPAVVESAAPAVPAAPSAPAVPAAPVVVPDIPVVAAYKARKRIPFWAMIGLSILPVWGVFYARALTPVTVEATGPVGEGEGVFASCSGCHGNAGQGINGRQLSEGEVWLTFPNIEDQLNLVYTGSEAYEIAGVGPYGNAARGHLKYQGAYMPAQKENLTQYEILEVVCYTRYGLNEIEGFEESEEYLKWCSEESEIFAALEDGSANFDDLHTLFEDVIPVGTTPRPGQSGPAG